MAASAVAARLEPLFPGKSRELNSMLAELLVYLQSPTVAAKAVTLLPRRRRRRSRSTWPSPSACSRPGGRRSCGGSTSNGSSGRRATKGGTASALFVEHIRKEAIANLPPDEVAALKDIIEAKPAAAMANPQAAFASVLKGRDVVKEWTVDDFAAQAGQKPLTGRDFERGRQMAGAVGCFACHRFANEGGAVGPDLTGVAGRFNAARPAGVDHRAQQRRSATSTSRPCSS